jgi:hypothetical protein
MKKIALVCEGGTDQRFLEWLLDGIYDGQIQTNSLQPALDATDKDRQGNFGGWENVFAFFERPNAVDEVFATNDYLVIQIDTDVCEHENFGVSKRLGQQDKTIIELISSVHEKLIEKMGAGVYKKYHDRIGFAICVHSLECWVLPLYAKKPADIAAVLTCEARLHGALAATGQRYEKSSPFYRKICRPIRKKDGYELCFKNNESFRIFVDSLPRLTPIADIVDAA